MQPEHVPLLVVCLSEIAPRLLIQSSSTLSQMFKRDIKMESNETEQGYGSSDDLVLVNLSAV